MATRIRLARGGTKKRPFYRIVVAALTAPRDGRFVERIGSYDPLLKENKSTVDLERARYWLAAGALPSDRVRKLLILHGIELQGGAHTVAAGGQGGAPAAAAGGQA